MKLISRALEKGRKIADPVTASWVNHHQNKPKIRHLLSHLTKDPAEQRRLLWDAVKSLRFERNFEDVYDPWSNNDDADRIYDSLKAITGKKAIEISDTIAQADYLIATLFNDDRAKGLIQDALNHDHSGIPPIEIVRNAIFDIRGGKQEGGAGKSYLEMMTLPSTELAEIASEPKANGADDNGKSYVELLRMPTEKLATMVCESITRNAQAIAETATDWQQTVKDTRKPPGIKL